MKINSYLTILGLQCGCLTILLRLSIRQRVNKLSVTSKFSSLSDRKSE